MRFCPHCGAPLTERLVERRTLPACDACGFVAYQNPKLAVAVVLAVAGKILLERRAINPGLGKWSFPSGYVDRGEVVELEAVREVREETGLEVRIEQLLGLYSEPGNPVVVAVYAASLLGGELRPNDEVSEIGFFPPDDLPPLAFPHDREIIAAWRAWMEQRGAGADPLPEGERDRAARPIVPSPR